MFLYFANEGLVLSSNNNKAIIDNATIVEVNEYDSKHSYTLVDGLAVKGSLIQKDTVEEAKMEAEYQATKYQQDRQYPSIGDQLDALFKAGAFPAEMASQIQAVKDAYPKPTA